LFPALRQWGWTLQPDQLMTMHRWFLIVLAAACGVPLCGIQAAPPKRVTHARAEPRALLNFETEYLASLDEADSKIKVGTIVDLVLSSGKRMEAMEIANIQRGKEKQTFRTLSVKGAKSSLQKFTGAKLMQVQAHGEDFDVALEPSTKTYVLLDGEKRNSVAAARLKKRGRKLWKEPTREQAAKAVEEHKELFSKIAARFTDRAFHLHETKFFLFYTDMPAEQVGGYIAELDSMYQNLCVAFGIPPDKNIWLGKCGVIAFQDRGTFQQFESELMDNADTKGVQGLSHGMGNGKVLTTCYRGNSATHFASVLVHETAHGFVHRFRSSADVPGWINEGIADWIAGMVVTSSDTVENRQSMAVLRMRTNGSMGGDFLDGSAQLDGWQYGVASSLTQFMVTENPNQYRAFLTAIKEGFTWEQSLKMTFGVTPSELAEAYGQSIGIQGLKP
jgi:hypothetical protein